MIYKINVFLPWLKFDGRKCLVAFPVIDNLAKLSEVNNCRVAMCLLYT